MEFCVFLLIAAALVLGGCVSYLLKKFDNILSVISKQSLRIGDHEGLLLEHDEKIKKDEYNYNDFRERLEAIEQKVKDLPVEDLIAMQKAEEAWNEGVQNILNFGIDTMKKGAVNNE